MILTQAEIISDPSPTAIVAAIEAPSIRIETPCGNGTMVWRRWGDGSPLLFLHGAHGSWTHWIRSISYFARTHTVWVPDLPGYGGSALPESVDDGDSFAKPMASGIRQLLADTGARIDIIGFSLGGVLGAHLAAIAPDVVRRLILVDTGGLGPPLGRFTTASVKGLADPEEIMRIHRGNLLALMLHNPASVDALAIHLQAVNVPRGRVNPKSLVMPDRMLQGLRRIKIPVDAIWGEQDHAHPNPELQCAVLRSVRPDAEFRVIPGAGHWCMFESAERFNLELEALLGARLELR